MITVRLTRHREGTVEIYYNGEWGSVCDNGWDNADAGVICKELGFGTSGIAVHSAYFGHRSGPIWLDGVFCSGNEPNFTYCGHYGIGNVACSHAEDAGVICGMLYLAMCI